MNIEKYIAIYGEDYRPLIESALEWLDETQSKWELETEIDTDAFIADLIANIKRS